MSKNRELPKKETSIHKIVNRNNLINGLYEKLILHIFYNRITRKFMNVFTKAYIVVHSSAIGRSFKRTSNTPYTKWYIKRYFNKYLKI